MRKALILTVLAACLLVVVLARNPGGAASLIPLISPPSPTPTPRPGIVLQTDSGDIRAQWIEVKDLSGVSLSQNLKEPKPAAELKTDNGCTNIVNAGFYDTDSTPIGLFITKGFTESEYHTNSLLNGIFGITFGEKAFLGTTYPRGSTRVAIQSGPLLMKDGVEQKLQLKNDEAGRRMVVGLTDTESVVFIAFYKDSHEYEGPLLAELASLVKDFDAKANLNIISALNLDGGTASAFYSPNVSLQEISYIGSYFCIK